MAAPRYFVPSVLMVILVPLKIVHASSSLLSLTKRQVLEALGWYPQ